MEKFFPYLKEEDIEGDAEMLIAEFAQARGITIEPPIPIEDIVEKHLKMEIEFDDTYRRCLNVPRPVYGPLVIGLYGRPEADILGAIYFNERRIVIDECLDPVAHPSKEGRYRFTLAHEGGGHLRLHSHLFLKDPDQESLSLFPEPMAPAFICRSSEKKKREEWQADFYASCLLMPRASVFKAWRDQFGDTMPRTVRQSDRFEDSIPLHFEIKEFVQPFADKFLVSIEAMRIRLEKLGLLKIGVQNQLTLTAGR